MQKTNFGRVIDKEIHLLLKPQGFKRKGTTWSKETEHGFLVINRRCNPKRFDDLITAYPKFRFSIWLGVYYKFVGPPQVQHSMWTPVEEECHVRASLYKTFRQHEEKDDTTWAVRSDSKNLQDVLEDVRNNIKDVAIAFLEEYADPRNAFRLMQTKILPKEFIGWGSSDSPLFHFTFAYICLHLGEKTLAYRSFQEVMNRNVLSNFVVDDFQKLSEELRSTKEDE